MPFIESKISVKVTEEQEKELKSRLGQAISLIPGKSEYWLMTGFEDEYHMYFRGENSEPMAYVDVRLFGGPDKAAYAKMTEEIKQKKLAEMASQSIEAIVPQIMSQSGYEWNLQRAYKGWRSSGPPDGYILRVKMKKHKMVEITLSQNNFANKIPGILNVVKQIEQLLEQAPYAVNIKSYGPGIQWIKDTEGAKFPK